MRDLNENNITHAVIDSFKGCDNSRLTELLSGLVTHLHDYMREYNVTEEEWMSAIQFLTRTGQMCDDVRQEFILLSDTLGSSTLMDSLNHRVPEGATESAVLGPFYLEGAPDIDNGENIWRAADIEGGIPCLVRGKVRDTVGNGIANAVLDVWQTAPNGLYNQQDPTHQPEMNLRGKLLTREDGSYEFRTVRPVAYSIPGDGPVGDMLNALNRHTMRPAHIHFIASAPGYRAVTTQIFDVEDGYIDSDAVFSVHDSVLVDFVDDGEGGVTVDSDFVLVADE